MAVPGSLPQQMYVLAWNPDSGRVGLGTPLGALLRAAALADLYAGGHVTDDRGRVVPAARRPCDDPVLAGLLDEIAASKPRKWQYWVDRRQRATVTAVRRQLGDGGWARLRPYRILGLIPATAVTVRDPRVRGELLSRVGGALKKPVHRVDPADAALVAISAAAGLSVVLDRKARRANRRRIRELTALSGPAVPALRRSIEDAALGGEAAA